MQKHSRTIQKRAFRAEVVERMMQEVTGPVRSLGFTINSNCRAARSEPSDTGLGCSTRCWLLTWFQSTRARYRTLRGDSVLQVRWDPWKTFDVGISDLMGEYFICHERGGHAARTISRLLKVDASVVTI